MNEKLFCWYCGFSGEMRAGYAAILGLAEN